MLLIIIHTVAILAKELYKNIFFIYFIVMEYVSSVSLDKKRNIKKVSFAETLEEVIEFHVVMYQPIQDFSDIQSMYKWMEEIRKANM